MWLLAEECKAQFYMGWWLYVRDRNDGSKNDDGEWGWQRDEHRLQAIEQFLRRLGEAPPPAERYSQALAEWFGRTYPGGLRVHIDKWGEPVRLAKTQENTMGFQNTRQNMKASTSKGKAAKPQAGKKAGDGKSDFAGFPAKVISRAIRHISQERITTIAELQRAMNLPRDGAAALFDHLIDEGYVVFKPGPKGSTVAVILKEPPDAAAGDGRTVRFDPANERGGPSAERAALEYRGKLSDLPKGAERFAAGTSFGFSIRQGDTDPRTEMPATGSRKFKLEVVADGFEASLGTAGRGIRLANDDGSTFAISFRHWNAVYAPCDPDVWTPSAGSAGSALDRSGADKAEPDGRPLRFDPANPWPERTIITTTDGVRGRLIEVDMENKTGTILWDHGVRKTIFFEDWQEVLGGQIESVEFPASGRAGRRRLEWNEGIGKDEWEAESIAYEDTEGGLTWRIRPSGKGKSRGWSLYASDAELLADCTKIMIGPYLSVDGAKAAGQEFDDQFGRDLGESENPQAAPDATSGRNPQSKPPKADMMMIPVDAIDASRNVRTAPTERTLFSQRELADSIADLGLLEPVLVRKIPTPGPSGRGAADPKIRFRMIAGHRRLAAVKAAGEIYIEAKVYGGDADDRFEAKARAAENIIRTDLNHIEMSRLFAVDADAGLTVAEIAAMHHVSDDTVRRHLALRRLCPPVATLTASGRLPVQHAEVISRVGDFLGQIGLAGDATRLAWDARDGRWAARGSYNWRSKSCEPAKGEPTIADRDYILPMDQLRKAVADAMQGLAACGWPMAEEYAGRRACRKCPDNTQTYADQPKLFEGIEPAGSAKKGHCTNGPCYEAKKAAWEKVVDQRRKEKEREQKKTVAKAKKAGLDVCGADGCARVLATGEKLEKIDGVGMCPKCAEKAKKRTERHGNSETWQSRAKRVKAAKKQFPWTPEQKLAAAIHKHGQDVAELIAKAIADGTAGGDGNCANVAEIILWAQGVEGDGTDAPKVCPTVEQVTGAGIPDADLAEWWRVSAGWAEYSSDEPGVNYDGKIKNVPLPAKHLQRIAGLERIAAACGVTVPARPSEEETAEPGTGNPEPVKKKRKTKAASQVPVAGKAEAAAPPPPPGKPVKGTCRICGCTDDTPCDGGCSWVDGPKNTLCSACFDLSSFADIVIGKRGAAIPVINGCTDIRVLEAATGYGLKGDWRRAAVAKRIAALKCDGCELDECEGGDTCPKDEDLLDDGS